MLTRKDKIVCMQNAVADDFWELAIKIDRQEVRIDFRYIIIQIGLDWCLDMKKNLLKEGLRRLLYLINKKTQGRAIVGIVGITPRLADYQSSKVKVVTFNRCLLQGVKDCQRQFRVQFLPWHLHFLEADSSLIQPVHCYFNRESEYKLSGGMVICESLLKTMGVTPMDGRF